MARGERSPETREALLGAAARVFVRRGLYGATVREIVGEAGLTAPALYYHFEGKEDVYAQLIRSGARRFRELVDEAIASGAGTAATLDAIARACIRFAEEDRTRLRVFYAELFRPAEATALDLGVAELRSWTRGRVAEVLRDFSGNGGRCADVDAASGFFLALLSGLLSEQAYQPEEALLVESMASELVAIFLWGVAGAKERR